MRYLIALSINCCKYLKREDIEPSEFQAMNVGAATRSFCPENKGIPITDAIFGILPKETALLPMI